MIGVFMALANVYDQGVPHLIGRIPLAFLILVTVLGKANCSELLPADINQYSRSSIGKLYNRAAEACTGVIISPVQVATAAHCLYNPRTGMLLHPESRSIFLWVTSRVIIAKTSAYLNSGLGRITLLDNRTMESETSD